MVVSCCDDSTDELIKDIVSVELPQAVQTGEGSQAYPWSIETKYYTATIHIHTTSASVSAYEDATDNIHGLILLFSPNQKASLDLAAKWIEKCNCEVVLVVCKRCPANADPEGVSRQQVLEWCLERACELIETEPNEEDDEEDATGVKRIVEALHAHPWPNLCMKDSSRPSGTTDRAPDLAAGDAGQACRDLELFSEAMADGEDISFEELFAKFKDMKVEADKLSGEDRKKFAEKVAVQFWRAFGGEEDEVAGLSSEDEAEK